MTSIRPTCIEDADGSLVIVDTGGWYKLCCPTSQLQKPDVLGAIYRVRRHGIPRLVDPWGQMMWERQKDLRTASMLKDFVKLLGDPRPAVQRHVIDDLSRPGSEAAVLPMLRQVATNDSSPLLRRNTVWTLARIDDPAARSMVHDFLRDPDETVRQAAIHVTGLWRDKSAIAARSSCWNHHRLRTAAPPPRHWAESATSRPCRRS